MHFTPKAELLTEVTPQEAARLIEDNRYGAQTKENGKRRIIVREYDEIYCFNREGEKCDLPLAVFKILRQHDLERFVIDVELCGSESNPQVKIFDALILGDGLGGLQVLAEDKYWYRLERVKEDFGNFHPMFQVLETTRTSAEKLALTKKLYAEKAEGVVFKRMSAPYRQGRANQHYKLKFVKTLDAVVIGPSPEGKDSVELGLYDSVGKLHRICSSSLIGKQCLRPHDVVEIRYLYGTKTLHVVQPRIIQKRDDKHPRKCLLDQIVVNCDQCSYT